MEHEVRGYGFDGRLGSLFLERMAFRSKIEKDSAYFYIPVDNNENVQQAQYDVLDALNADLVTLEPQKPDRLHITLLYIEKVKDDDLEDFFNRLNLIMPVAFELEVVRSGTFTESDERPLVLHLAPSPSLLRLQQELYDTAFSMGLPISVHSKPKYYSPHISLAYNYMPQDIKIPDLAAPFKIPIYNFVCTRPEYEVVRTIHLPNFHNEEVLVTRLLGGAVPAPTGQAQVSEADSTSTTGARGKDIEDERIEQMLADEKLPDSKLPETVRIVYTPDLEIESRQTRSRDFVDIELGPPFWDIGDRGVRAGALAFQFGNIVADEMILGLGGAHEWSRADAMLQAPPKEQEAGFRFVFGTNSIIWAASYCYASYIINGPQEMQSRGYEDALRWIEIALEQYPDYNAENAPDFHSLIDQLGDFPPEGVVPDYLIGKGGEGSGHHGHKGRPGEIGGSLPAGEGHISFNPNDIEDVQKQPGFCFKTSAKWLMDGQGSDYPQAHLAHGTVMGRGPIEGKRFTHSWVEIDDWVFDPTQNLLAEKNKYYDLAQAENVVIYDPNETRIELLKNKNWGPWDEFLLNFREEESKQWFETRSLML